MDAAVAEDGVDAAGVQAAGLGGGHDGAALLAPHALVADVWRPELAAVLDLVAKAVLALAAQAVVGRGVGGVAAGVGDARRRQPQRPDAARVDGRDAGANLVEQAGAGGAVADVRQAGAVVGLHHRRRVRGRGCDAGDVPVDDILAVDAVVKVVEAGVGPVVAARPGGLRGAVSRVAVGDLVVRVTGAAVRLDRRAAERPPAAIGTGEVRG